MTENAKPAMPGGFHKMAHAEKQCAYNSNFQRQTQVNSSALGDDGEPDISWAVDHPRRRYRVRPFRLGDEIDPGAYQLEHEITIIDLKSLRRYGALTVFKQRLVDTRYYCSPPGTWEDNDQWAA